MTRYGLPNKDRTAVARWWPNNHDRIFPGPAVDRLHPTEAEILAAGFLPLNIPAESRWKKCGQMVITETEITHGIIEPTLAEKKAALVDEVYRKAAQVMAQATAQYSAAEMSQWPEMVARAEANDTAYFEPMSGPGVSGADYAAVVLAKDTELKSVFNAAVKNRNVHKEAIEAAADVDAYDTTTGW